MPRFTRHPLYKEGLQETQDSPSSRTPYPYPWSGILSNTVDISSFLRDVRMEGWGTWLDFKEKI